MRVQAWLAISATVGAFAAAAMHQMSGPRESIADADRSIERGAAAVPVDGVAGLDVETMGGEACAGDGDALTDTGDHSLRSGSASDVLTRNSSDGSEDARRLARRGR